jgi:hypothetical protein
MGTPSAAGMPTSHRDPQVKGAKVKILLNKKGEPRQRLPKKPIQKTDVTDLQEQSTIYLRERNRAMRLKRMREEMLLAHARGQLIEKGLVIKQLSYLFIGMRQKILLIPSKTGNRFGDRDVQVREVVEYLHRQVHEVLTELSRLPECVEPDWLEKLEEE